jgi:ferrous iron transport protein B
MSTAAAASNRLRVADPPVRDAGDASGAHPRFNRIALVGNPNVGKSAIFGALTGTYATVSNYPGTTVEVARARARFDPNSELIDTPGVNGLTPSSEDERVTRDILLAGVDAVVQIADAKNLPRALSLSLQLAETGLPFVLVLNMMDEAADRGIAIDATKLSAQLGVPVVETVAVTGRGLSHLGEVVAHATVSRCRARHPAAIERALLRIEGLLSGSHVAARWLALLCLAGDDSLQPWLKRHVPGALLPLIEDARRDLQVELRGPASYPLNRARLRTVAQLTATVAHSVRADATGPTRGERRDVLVAVSALAATAALLLGDMGLLVPFAGGWPRAVAWSMITWVAFAIYRSPAMRASLGRWAGQRGTGLAVLFVILYLLYRFVGVFAAGSAVDFLENEVFAAYFHPVVISAADWLLDWLSPTTAWVRTTLVLARDLFVGPYGLVTVALTYAVAIILPIVTAFFLAFSVLEDSGYLPRLALMVNRTFRAMGLNGKAVLPMVLGLGCDTMATLTARIMETRKERLLVTLLLALGVPCSAQLGVILGLLGALPPWAALVWGGVVLWVLFVVGFLAARLLPGERSDLILELPPIRQPQLANIALKTIARLEWYLKEAVPIFVLGTFVLFVLDATGSLSRIVRAGEPTIVGWLGLPAQATEAFLVGFFRRDYGSAGIYKLFRDGALAPAQAVVALVTITLFVPCVANFFVIVKERGLATAIAISAFIFPLAFAVGGMVNLGLRAVGVR